MLEDTIAAIATPPGEGGIGIVRISGSMALEILKNIIKTKNGEYWQEQHTHTLRLGDVVDSQGNVIDEVLVSIMRGPRSYTGEDVAEINCHGGSLPLRLVMERVLDVGARVADPGEFTKRAFLNGKMDLTQAEAVIDIIRAKTDSSLAVANSQLQGKLSEKIEGLRRNLVRVMAYIEANIDFPDEEIDSLPGDEVREKVLAVKAEVKELITSADEGMIMREGLSTVIIGKPNVGKSSLLNALLSEERVIVTEIPGTTRDVIQETVNLGGLALNLIDTAGIRETTDLIEIMGVERSKEWLEKADLVLMVMDAQASLDEEDSKLFELIEGRRVIIIINKIDLGPPKMDTDELARLCGNVSMVKVSAKERLGLKELESTVRAMVLNSQEYRNSFDEEKGQIIISRMRHKRRLIETDRHLTEVLNSIDVGMPEDFWSIDLRVALEKLGEITGTAVTEEVIETIFEEFCIGK